MCSRVFTVAFVNSLYNKLKILRHFIIIYYLYCIRTQHVSNEGLNSCLKDAS